MYASKILYSYFACSQIWLNLHLDDHHFGYIRKLMKKIKIKIKIKHIQVPNSTRVILVNFVM
jgi:hypothetical protein